MLKHWKDPVDEEKELRDAFKVFDRNNDGYVSADEIKYVMKNLGHDLSDADVDDIMKKADVNGDGRLDYSGMILKSSKKRKKLKISFVHNLSVLLTLFQNLSRL